jgi:hypothetical protein
LQSRTPQATLAPAIYSLKFRTRRAMIGANQLRERNSSVNIQNRLWRPSVCVSDIPFVASDGSPKLSWTLVFYGKVLYGTKPQLATLIALDLSFIGLEGSSVDHTEIEITYKDEPCGSQKELQARRIIEPRVEFPLDNLGALASDDTVLFVHRIIMVYSIHILQYHQSYSYFIIRLVIL